MIITKQGKTIISISRNCLSNKDITPNYYTKEEIDNIVDKITIPYVVFTNDNNVVSGNIGDVIDAVENKKPVIVYAPVYEDMLGLINNIKVENGNLVGYTTFFDGNNIECRKYIVSVNGVISSTSTIKNFYTREQSNNKFQLKGNYATEQWVTDTMPFSISEGNNSVVLNGVGAGAYKVGSIATGYNCVSNGAYSFVGGKNCSNISNSSFVYGENCISNSYQTAVFGKNNTVNKGFGFAAGAENITNNTYEAAFGKFNKSTTNQTLFAVGFGNADDNRKNAVEITTNGKLLVYGLDVDLVAKITSLETEIAQLKSKLN